MIVINALQSVFSIVLMISIGYVLTEKKWFNEDTTKLFSKLVVNISLPALMISNLMTTYDREKLNHSFLGLAIPFLSMGICYIIGLILSKVVKINTNRRGAFLSMFFVSNTIFIGLPVNLSLFGDKSVPYVLLYYIANTTFFWTLGVYGISRDGGKTDEKVLSVATLKRILSPPLLSFVLAIVLILLNIKLPLFIMDTCKYLGNLTTPLSMLFIGITIHSIDIKDIKPDTSMFLILIGRFIISPLSVYILSIFIPIPLLMKKVFIIQAAMPVMTQTAIISKEYGSDHKYVAVMITITTIACLIFIPLYMYLFTL